LADVGRAPSKPTLKLNLYHEFIPAKRANSIRLVVNLRDLQALIGYLKSPMALLKGSASLRKIFQMTAITLIKAWIAFIGKIWKQDMLTLKRSCFCLHTWWTRLW